MRKNNKPRREFMVLLVAFIVCAAVLGALFFKKYEERFAGGVELLKDTCPGLVQQIELGDLDGPATHRILERALNPMLERNIDTVVLGCTHYPFVISLIQDIVGERVRVIDPAPAIARQAGRVLQGGDLGNPGETRGQMRFFTSGVAKGFDVLLPRLLGERGPVSGVHWDGDRAIRELQPSGD